MYPVRSKKKDDPSLERGKLGLGGRASFFTPLNIQIKKATLQKTRGKEICRVHKLVVYDKRR